MKTFDIYDHEKRLLAFEIGNTIVGRRRACRLIAGIPGTSVTRRPKMLSWLRESSFCEFTLDGVSFEVEEPFGDSSRYWVGPMPSRFVAATQKLRDAFALA